MAVRLRLMRLGRKGQPFYRIVAVDSRKRRDGAYIEKIGHYNPNARPAEFVMDDDKALKWLSTGAIPSDTVRSLLSRHGVMMAFDLSKRGLSAEEITARVSAHRQALEGKLQAQAEAARPKSALKPTTEIVAEPEATVETATEPELKVETAVAPEENAPIESEISPSASENTPSESENTPTEETQS